MVQIVPRSNWFGEALEKSLGPVGAGASRGISSGLEALANLKLQQLQARQQQQQAEEGYAQMPGMSPDQARALSKLPPQAAAVYFKELAAAPRYESNAQMVQQILGQPQGQPVEAQQPIQMQMQPGQQPQMPGTQQQQGLQVPKRIDDRQFAQLAQLGMSNKKLAQQQAQHEEDMQFKREQAGAKTKQQLEKQIAESYKNHQKRFEEVERQGVEARNDKASSENLMALSQSGKMIQGPQLELINAMGLSPFVKQPAQDVAQGYIANMQGHTLRALGASKATNKVIELEKAIVPNAFNTKAGFENRLMDRIIKDDAEDIRDKMYRKVKKQYSDKHLPYPENIEDIAEEQAAPLLEKNANRALNNNAKYIKQQYPEEFEPGHEGERMYIEAAPNIIWRKVNGDWIVDSVGGF